MGWAKTTARQDENHLYHVYIYTFGVLPLCREIFYMVVCWMYCWYFSAIKFCWNELNLSFVIWCDLYKRFYGIFKTIQCVICLPSRISGRARESSRSFMMSNQSIDSRTTNVKRAAPHELAQNKQCTLSKGYSYSKSSLQCYCIDSLYQHSIPISWFITP